MSTISQRMLEVEKTVAGIKATVDASLGTDGYVTKSVRSIADDLKPLREKQHAHEVRLDRLEHWQRFVKRAMLLLATPAAGLLLHATWGMLRR